MIYTSGEVAITRSDVPQLEPLGGRENLQTWTCGDIKGESGICITSTIFATDFVMPLNVFVFVHHLYTHAIDPLVYIIVYQDTPGFVKTIT